MCKKGPWENFSHDVFDFQESELEEEITVGELYTLLKMGMLRFYLSTKCIPPDDELNVSDTETQAEIHKPEEHCETPIIFVDSTDSLSESSEVIIGPYTGEYMVSQLDDTLLYEPMHLPVTQDSDLAITNFIYPSTSDAVSMIDLSLTEEAFSPVADQVDDAAHTVNSSASEYELLHVTIKLHRITLLDEMIGQFKDPRLITYKLKYSIIDEMGADEDGVSRDVYSGFWSEFLDRAAEGEDMRVPSLSPKWQEEDWKSIGRILVKGYRDQGYFPTRLATAFTVALIFGEHSVTDEMMIDSFLLYLSQSERELVSGALKEDLLGDDKDELLDLLDRLGVTTMPTQQNLKELMLKAGHKQIIQLPKYALDNMSKEAKHIFRETFKSPVDILQMYEDKRPITRRILKLLDVSPQSQAESKCLRFLQQYIRGLDVVGLRKMLRFVTGSDVVSVDKIQVIFTSLDGLARRPVAHTCGPVLELPSTYSSYQELRSEMESTLSSTHALVMDIV